MYDAPLVPFREMAQALTPGDHRGEMSLRWYDAIMLGRATDSNEHIVGVAVIIVEIRNQGRDGHQNELHYVNKRIILSNMKTIRSVR